MWRTGDKSRSCRNLEAEGQNSCAVVFENLKDTNKDESLLWASYKQATMLPDMQQYHH